MRFYILIRPNIFTARQTRRMHAGPYRLDLHTKVAARQRNMARITLLLVAALCIHSPLFATASRLLRQAAADGNSNTPGPSPLSEVYNATAMANSPNFTFWQEYDTRVTGEPGKEGFAVQLVNRTNPEQNISAWHDIPLGLERTADGGATLWTLVEIPEGDQAKYETMTKEPGNPIMQDTDDIKNKTTGEVIGTKLRYYVYGGSRGNYGGLTQTWENSNRTDTTTGFVGDHDPVDVLDIGAARAPIGGVYRVKVLGVLAMVDSNETDWKVIAINVKDPNAARFNNITDIPQATLDHIFDFYSNYKQAEGKPAVQFYPLNSTNPADHFLGAAFAVDQVVIPRVADHQQLLAGGCDTEDCQELWWAGKPEAPAEAEEEEEQDSQASPAPASG